MKVITRAQRQELKVIYDRKPLPMTYRQFRKTAFGAFLDTCVMVEWCGMLLGIEPDGYTHS